MLFHYFDRFLAEYESRFEKEYGFLRPIIKEVVERYLDCGNPRCGFARIRCPDCHAEHLLMFSCRTRGLCPSCHAKRLEEWGDWMRQTLLLDVPHRGNREARLERLELPTRCLEGSWAAALSDAR